MGSEMVSFVIWLLVNYRQNSKSMFESGNTIDYDTSLKKYPYNKYLNYNEMDKLSRKMFKQHKSSDHRTNKSNPTKKSYKKNKKSLTSSKTMCSSRVRALSKQANTIVSITPQNFKAFTKQDIASQLNHYKQLCLDLRKENYSLKVKLDEKSRAYKESLVGIQTKINKLNEKNLEVREKELKQERERIIDHRGRDGVRAEKRKESHSGSHRQMGGEFKRFFLTFLDHYGRVDQRVNKKSSLHKNIEAKMLLSQKLLKESCEFLQEKKFKFKSVYE